jgi:ABC-type amino acid transport system permease subunit
MIKEDKRNTKSMEIFKNLFFLLSVVLFSYFGVLENLLKVFLTPKSKLISESKRI